MSAYIEVLPANAERAEWLQARRTGIGSSDIAGVLNQSSWASPYSVWWDKVGPLVDREPTESMEWGIRLEPVIADAWRDKTRTPIARIGLCRSVDRPWQLATPDRITPDGEPVETKSADRFDIDEWDSDTIPLKYVLQIHQQIDVLGAARGHLAVLIGGNDFRTFIVERDPEIITIIRARGAEFWQLVNTRTAPPTDGHDATTDAVKRRWQIPDNEEATVVLDADWIGRLDRRELLKLDIKNMTAACTATDNALRDAIADATHAVAAGQLVATWKPRRDGVRVLNVIESANRKEVTRP